MFDIVLAINPVAKQRARVLKTGHSFTPAKTKKYEDELRKIFSVFARKNKIKPLSVALFLQVDFYLEKPKTNKNRYPTTRPDLDNYLKSIMDAGNGILWTDDSVIVKIQSTKSYAYYVNPSICVSVKEII